MRSKKQTAQSQLEGRGQDLYYRNVHEDQQITRSRIEEKQSPLSRIILVSIAALLVFLGAWVLVGSFEWGASQLGSLKAEQEFEQAHKDEVAYYNPYNEQSFVVPVVTKEPNKYNVEVDVTRYHQMQADGSAGEQAWDEKKDVPAPKWWLDQKASYEAKVASGEIEAPWTLKDYLIYPTMWKLLLASFAALITFGLLYQIAMRNLEAQNLMNDPTDINQSPDDGHIMLHSEMWDFFDFFPDAGGHCSVQASTVISHMMIANKGLKTVTLPKRYQEDGTAIIDGEEVPVLKGETVFDENGEDVYEELPLMDEKFADDLFTASYIPQLSTEAPEPSKNKLVNAWRKWRRKRDPNAELRRWFDPTQIPYNPGNKNRNKLKGYDTLAQMLNGDVEMPEYEFQRPAGVYLVDTEPVNTMGIAITRAGKGQTLIEPTIDIWSREKQQNNMVVNDPKGELLKKFFVILSMRGYQIVQFNLINEVKTDISNPLLLAAQSAREGDFVKAAAYVENIAEVFFPLDGGEDPLWPNAANNAFKRTAYGLIDYYLEKERQIRSQAEAESWPESRLEDVLDEMWGKVTLYNCYQFFVQLSSRKLKNPLNVLKEQIKSGQFEGTSEEEMAVMQNDAKRRSELLWEDKPEIDKLTLYFNAVKQLPRNEMRRLVGNTDDSLRSMGAAEKMLASVYGIALTAMSFFTNPTISTLTSGRPSQNIDLAGFSFPRRIGFRLAASYVAKNNLLGKQVRWQGYKDKKFSESLGPKFSHQDLVTRSGWSRCYFEGILEGDVCYWECQVVEPMTGQRLKTFRFEFNKGYSKSLDGRRYMKDPILRERIALNGTLVELVPDGKGNYVRGHVTYQDRRIVSLDQSAIDNDSAVDLVRQRAITQHMVRYSEKPKAMFMVTPPHLMQYAKLLLIILKQLVDLNFDQSYMTKGDQKPLLKTRFMLDEVGNLQSEGHGIANLQTLLSIGLGQDQQFTLILQTLQQLRDIYGDSVDRIIQGNAQPLDARILTPCGWITMGEAQVGTPVVTPSGHIKAISGVYPRGERKVYRVTTKNGASTRCCGEHLWRVRLVKPTGV